MWLRYFSQAKLAEEVNKAQRPILETWKRFWHLQAYTMIELSFMNHQMLLCSWKSSGVSVSVGVYVVLLRVAPPECHVPGLKDV